MKGIEEKSRNAARNAYFLLIIDVFSAVIIFYGFTASILFPFGMVLGMFIASLVIRRSTRYLNKMIDSFNALSTYIDNDDDDDDDD